MKVKLKKLNRNARVPTKGREGDLCYDVYAVTEEEVASNVWRYGLGLAFQIERPEQIDNAYWDERVNLSIDFRPRSSVWKTGMVLSNCCGTIDEFYRGEVMAVFYHVMPNMPRYKVGDRIGQIKIGATVPIEFEVTDELFMDTERGVGGFGSTDDVPMSGSIAKGAN